MTSASCPCLWGSEGAGMLPADTWRPRPNCSTSRVSAFMQTSPCELGVCSVLLSAWTWEPLPAKPGRQHSQRRWQESGHARRGTGEGQTGWVGCLRREI